LILDERTFSVRVCIVTLFVSWATSPGWGMRGNRSGVGVRAKEEHDAIHSIAREFREFGQGVEDVLLLFLRSRARGQGL